MIVLKNLRGIKSLVYGASFFGGGGGGWISEGLELGRLAFELTGEVRILDPHEVSDDYILVTVSAVGAPAAEERYLKPVHLIRSVELLIENGVGVEGLIPSEVGAYNGVNGLIQSAMLGIPVVDMPCNGRAHPTGLMGSMGLHRIDGYISKQAVAGGDPSKGKYIELYVSAKLESATSIVRRAAVEAGGLVAVARNPIDAGYAKEHGAPGALRKAYEVGRMMSKHISKGDTKGACYAAFKEASGEVIGECTVSDVSLETREGFDVGSVSLDCGGAKYMIRFVNEYITLDKGSRRIATFPDLISLMNLKTGLPVTSAELPNLKNETVLLGFVPRDKLILGSGVKYPEAYTALEKILNVKIVEFIHDVLIG